MSWIDLQSLVKRRDRILVTAQEDLSNAEIGVVGALGLRAQADESRIPMFRLFQVAVDKLEGGEDVEGPDVVRRAGENLVDVFAGVFDVAGPRLQAGEVLEVLPGRREPGGFLQIRDRFVHAAVPFRELGAQGEDLRIARDEALETFQGLGGDARLVPGQLDLELGEERAGIVRRDLPGSAQEVQSPLAQSDLPG